MTFPPTSLRLPSTGDGRIVVQERHLVTMDEEKIAADARKACAGYLAKA